MELLSHYLRPVELVPAVIVGLADLTRWLLMGSPDHVRSPDLVRSSRMEPPARMRTPHMRTPHMRTL
ncbi:hypothetical protein Aple_011660 [Acrocarpospora pleiomorpha]|uniref:Uncharacterized protein n=1 Tax=Acrocarpospora pleiomorpha TaxID=90975 RepID=A0A5M3XF95_9ACTN|nr:hypothetical protein Aple_011660 [Acrocarpospora pleiomorpha]